MFLSFNLQNSKTCFGKNNSLEVGRWCYSWWVVFLFHFHWFWWFCSIKGEHSAAILPRVGKWERVLVDQMRFQVLFESIGGGGGQIRSFPQRGSVKHGTWHKFESCSSPSRDPTKSPVHIYCCVQNQLISHKSCTGAAKTSKPLSIPSVLWRPIFKQWFVRPSVKGAQWRNGQHSGGQGKVCFLVGLDRRVLFISHSRATENQNFTRWFEAF